MPKRADRFAGVARNLFPDLMGGVLRYASHLPLIAPELHFAYTALYL